MQGFKQLRLSPWALAWLGAFTVTGAHADWVVGQVAPLTGASAVQSKAYAQGMRLHFEQINKTGGIQGDRVRLVSVDDQGSPEATLQHTQRLLQESKPVALAGYFGNRNLLALVNSKTLDQAQISLVGFHSTDSRVLKAPQLFSTRAALGDEIDKIAKHLTTLGMTQLTVVYEERDAQDAQGLQDLVRQRLQEAGAQLVSSYMLKVDDAGEAAVQSLIRERAPAQAVIVIASSPLTADFVETYRMEGGMAQIYATSAADIEQLSTRLAVEMMRGVSIAQVVPNPYRSNNRLNKELRDLVAQKKTTEAVSVSYAMMEGYVNAKVLVEAMRRTQPLNSAKLSDTLRSIQGLDLGGYVVNFKPGSQSGSKFVDLSIVNAQGRVTQ